MDYTLNIVSKCRFFFIFKHLRALKRSWKIFHGGPGKSWIFLSVKECEPWCVYEYVLDILSVTCVRLYSPPPHYREAWLFSRLRDYRVLTSPKLPYVPLSCCIAVTTASSPLQHWIIYCVRDEVKLQLLYFLLSYTGCGWKKDCYRTCNVCVAWWVFAQFTRQMKWIVFSTHCSALIAAATCQIWGKFVNGV